MDEERLRAYLKRFEKIASDIQKDMLKEKDKTGKSPKLTGAEFEDLVYDELIKVGFSDEQIQHSSQKFPDFIITDENGEMIGLEVKKTDNSKWEVVGGSIFESLRNDIDETYVMMAKLGGTDPEVRIRKYEECIKDLKVTHSPRFSAATMIISQFGLSIAALYGVEVSGTFFRQAERLNYRIKEYMYLPLWEGHITTSAV